MKDSPSEQIPWRQRFGWALNILLIILNIYGVALILLLAVMLLPRRPGIIELLSNFISWALIPTLPVLIGVIALKRWTSAAIWAIPSLAFVVLFGGLFMPNFSSEHICGSGEGSCTHITVMTCNLWGKKGQDRQSQIDMLLDSGADIIALQEVNIDIVGPIEKQLSRLYPYQILFPSGVGGTGILSKYPISSQDVFKIDPDGLFHSKAVLDVYGVPITVISVHLIPPLSFGAFGDMSFQRDEIDELLEMTSDAGPVLLMGDFNLADQAGHYSMLTDAGLKDTYREVGWGFGPTFPVKLRGKEGFRPVVRIDYIWHTDDFQAVSARVGTKTVSDHLPVIAELIYLQN